MLASWAASARERRPPAVARTGCRHVRRHYARRRSVKAFIPQSFEPGEAYQFDWSHEHAEIAGVDQVVMVAHLRLCTSLELERLVMQISERIGRQLERQGLLVRDPENSCLALESDNADALTDLQGRSISYRIALGPQRGRKAFQLQTLREPGASCGVFPACRGGDPFGSARAAAEDLPLREPPGGVANERVSLTAQGKVRYALKSPYRDGTTHVIFEPLDFLSRLATLVPKPKVNLTRFHGVFAPHHRLRARIVPGKRATQYLQQTSGGRAPFTYS